MATKFKVWIDEADESNTLSGTDFSNDSQRKSGFSSGTAASSSRVNSIVRQNSLVSTALMSIIGPDSDVDLQSTLDDVISVVSNYFGEFIVGGKYDKDSSSLLLNLKSGKQISVSLEDILNSTVSRAIADKNGNDIYENYVNKNTLNNYYTKTNIDSGIVKTITTVNGSKLSFFVGTQSEYDALENKDNLFAIISDDTTKDEIFNRIESLESKVSSQSLTISSLNSTVNSLSTSVDTLEKKYFTKSKTIAIGSDGVSSSTVSLTGNGVYAYVYQVNVGGSSTPVYQNFVGVFTNVYLIGSSTNYNSYTSLNSGGLLYYSITDKKFYISGMSTQSGSLAGTLYLYKMGVLT